MFIDKIIWYWHGFFSLFLPHWMEDRFYGCLTNIAGILPFHLINKERNIEVVFKSPSVYNNCRCPICTACVCIEIPIVYWKSVNYCSYFVLVNVLKALTRLYSICLLFSEPH